MAGEKTVARAKAARRLYVVKANDIIRKSRYSLTAQQQKIVLFCISKIRPNDEPTTEYTIDIAELCAACNIEYDTGGIYYKNIKADLINLTQRYWVELPDKTLATVSWIGDAKILPYSSKVIIRFHPEMTPYLFKLKERYTQYRLEDVLPFKGKYAIRMYELLRSYVSTTDLDDIFKKRVTISISDLKYNLDIESYDRWIDFEKRVITPSINEINKYSEDINVTYEPQKGAGRNYESILFIITSAKAKQVLTARENKRQRLDRKKQKQDGEQLKMTI